MAAADPSPTHCLKERCLKKNKKKDVDMVRCVICCVWHHVECVSVPKEEMNLVWTCAVCRLLTDTVFALRSELSEMRSQQTEMMTLMQTISAKLESETEQKVKVEQELSKLKKEVSDMNSAVSEMQKPQQKRQDAGNTPTRDPEPPVETPKPCLLLGTSLLRNVDPNRLQNCEVIAKGGATIQDLNTCVSELPDEKEYSMVTVVGGSIDLENKDTEEIVTSYRALLVSVSLKSERARVCSVLPRTDKEVTEKRNKLNEELKKMCQEDGHTYLDMDDTFLLQNGTPNLSFLLSDGLHLAKGGVDNLVVGCNVELSQGYKSAFNEQRYQVISKKAEKVMFRGHQSPLSNFYPVRGLVCDGIPFASSEAAYVYYKARHHQDRQTAEAVKKSKTGIHAKRLGDKIITDNAWQEKKIDIMDNIVRAKLEVCPEARKALQNSGEKELVEDTPHPFWGRGHGDGLNMLGQIWMIQRKRIRSENNNIVRHNSRRTWASRDYQPKCYRCGETGHLQEQCRQRSDLTCWNCGSFGHKQKSCRVSTSRQRNYY